MKELVINMYIASLDGFSYEIYAVGKTEEECKANLIKGFKQYLKSYHTTFKEWLADCEVNYSDYNRDMWTFLHEYHGIHMFDITKGYALGWE